MDLPSKKSKTALHVARRLEHEALNGDSKGARNRATRRQQREPADYPATSAPDWADEAVADLPALCTTAEARQVLRISLRQLYRHTASGKLPIFREQGGKTILIPKAALAQFIRSMAPESTGPGVARAVTRSPQARRKGAR